MQTIKQPDDLAGREHASRPQIDAPPLVAELNDGMVQLQLYPWRERHEAYRAFADRNPHGTAQSFNWVEGFATHGPHEIVVVEVVLDDRPVVAFPLEVVRATGLVTARFVGGPHACANFPAVDPKLAPALRGQDLRRALVDAFGNHSCAVDLIRLDRQLTELDGIDNPLVSTRSPVSPNIALEMRTDMPFETVLERVNRKRKLRKYRYQARKFEDAGGYEIHVPQTQEDVIETLDFFYAQKALRFAAAGVDDTFAKDGASDALKSCFIAGLQSERHAGRLHALKVAGKIRAVSGTITDRGHQTLHFSAYAVDDIAPIGPGDFLNHSLVQSACESSVTVFDFGVGDETYKRSWCDIEVHHRDTMISLTLKGRAAETIVSIRRRAVSSIKRNERLWSLAKDLRARLRGRAE